MKKKNYFSKMKGIGKTCLLLVALSISSLAIADVTTGLKLHYDFETMDGGMVTDVSGTVTDGSQDGVLMGAAVAATGYDSPQGVNFPTIASGDNVDYVQLPNGITGALNDFTIATWVKMDRMSDWMRIFDFGAGQNNYLFLTPKAGGGNLRFAIKNGGSEEIINGIAPLVTGSWVHVAVCVAYDAITGIGSGKLYLNGNIVGTNNNITITPSMLDATLGTQTTQNYIGKSQYPDSGLNGTIDDFRIYDRALTDNDVLELNGISSELGDQQKALDLGDLTDVKTNLTLPTTMGTSGVTVKWASSNNAVIDTLGNVNIPPKYLATVTLTATLSYTIDGKTTTLIKVFEAVVNPVNPLPDEVAQWNFVDANISTAGGVVTVKDEFSNAFVGTVMNDARIRTIGTDTKYNVLDLGNGTGYFDMGTAIGEDVYSLNDKFTVGGYF